MENLKLFKTLLIAFFLSLAIGAAAQSPQVRGSVMDEQGKPLEGVSVIAKQEKTDIGSTTTDQQGSFTLAGVKADNVYDLYFSYIGYETYIEKSIRVTGNSVSLLVRLTPSAKELSNVVVTALGIERQSKSLGFSTQRVKSDAFENTKELNLVNAMIGKVAGLEINASTEMFISSDIRLRGVTPLLVVDGTPVNTTTWDLNFNDIESMDVLKGATAASLYGSRGINGAIVVTLKKGRSNKMKVEISSTNMIQPSLLT
ncbi:MAG: carboxypeptidase-like regulatory domain-containing protein, partial [Chitinophagaceae bacterium]|nr:carboxypeptidase-like regulatory domain-containing protein [Chitinophagaceae bacterium]